MRSKALFLDRDGVMNINHGYVSKPDEFDWIEGVAELLTRFQQHGYKLVVVTNQSGIGRGYYSEHDFHTLTEWMKRHLETQDIHIDLVKYCPHHPTHALAGYKKLCSCRKPAPGMLLRAADELSLDLKGSVFVGDSWSDMQAGIAAGVGRLIYFSSQTLTAQQLASIPSTIALHQVDKLDRVEPLTIV